MVIYHVFSAFRTGLFLFDQPAEVFRHLVEMQAEALCNLQGRAGPSFQIEEIEKHLSSGKPAMICFSSAPVRADSVDRDQYDALQHFKADCRRRGLTEEYESLAEFREKLTRQLAQTVIRYLPGYAA